MHILGIILGVTVDLFTAFLIFGCMLAPKGIEWGALVFLSAMFAGSTYFTHRCVKARRILRESKIEREILQIIRRKGGRVTPIEIAADSDLSAEEAKDVLARMCIKGFGEERVTENGALVYIFDGFLSEDEKREALQLTS